MPLTGKGQKILRKMESERGSVEAGKREFYASRNAGTISGVDQGRASKDGHFARIGGVNPPNRIMGRDMFKIGGGQGQDINTNSFAPGGRRR